MRKGTEGPNPIPRIPAIDGRIRCGDAGPRKSEGAPLSHCVYPWGHRKEVYLRNPRPVGRPPVLRVRWFALLEQSLRRELARVRKFCFESAVNHRTHFVKFKELVSTTIISQRKSNRIKTTSMLAVAGKHSMLPSAASTRSRRARVSRSHHPSLISTKLRRQRERR